MGSQHFDLKKTSQLKHTNKLKNRKNWDNIRTDNPCWALHFIKISLLTRVGHRSMKNARQSGQWPNSTQTQKWCKQEASEVKGEKQRPRFSSSRIKLLHHSLTFKNYRNDLKVKLIIIKTCSYESVQNISLWETCWNITSSNETFFLSLYSPDFLFLMISIFLLFLAKMGFHTEVLVINKWQPTWLRNCSSSNGHLRLAPKKASQSP